MSVTPGDFHQFAQRIAAAATCEIDHRNAISRTYYAAYHAGALRFGEPSAREHGINVQVGHVEFCNQLTQKSMGSPLRQLGVALNHLRQRRNAADYILGRDFTQHDVRIEFGAYGNVLKLLDQVLPPKEAQA